MNNKKESAVSPVVAVVLILALVGVIAAMVSVSVLSNVDNILINNVKDVDVTIKISGNDMSVYMVSGKDLISLEDYTLYRLGSEVFTPLVQSINATDYPINASVYHKSFNDNISYINIVGDFADGEQAVIFTGKIVDGYVVQTIIVENGPYKVTYDTNYGSGEAPEDNEEYEPGAVVTVADGSYLIKGSGIFSGWRINDPDSGSLVQGGETFLITSDTTLYANYTQVLRYNVSYYDGNIFLRNYTYDPGDIVYVIPNLNSGYAPGYDSYIIYTGWKDVNINKIYVNGTANDNFIINSDVRLNAEKIPYYLGQSVTYMDLIFGPSGKEVPDGESGYNVPNAINPSIGSTITIEEYTNAKNDGYTRLNKTVVRYYFNGWNTKDDGTGDPYYYPDQYTVNNNITFFAIWTDYDPYFRYGTTPESESVSNKWGDSNPNFGKLDYEKLRDLINGINYWKPGTIEIIAASDDNTLTVRINKDIPLAQQAIKIKDGWKLTIQVNDTLETTNNGFYPSTNPTIWAAPVKGFDISLFDIYGDLIIDSDILYDGDERMSLPINNVNPDGKLTINSGNNVNIINGNGNKIGRTISGGGGIKLTRGTLDNSGTINISNCMVNDEGGGICNFAGTITNQVNAVINVSDCLSNLYGGGIFNSKKESTGSGTGTITNYGTINVSYCKVVYFNGGGIFNDGANIVNEGVMNVYSNTANGVQNVEYDVNYGNGGGIYNNNFQNTANGATIDNNGTLNVYNNSAKKNNSDPTTTGNGGGIYNADNANNRIKNYENSVLNVYSNTAESDGGGIYVAGGRLYLNYKRGTALVNSIYGNTASGNGGGIWSSSNNNVYYGGTVITSLDQISIAKKWFGNNNPLVNNAAASGQNYYPTGILYTNRYYDVGNLDVGTVNDWAKKYYSNTENILGGGGGNRNVISDEEIVIAVKPITIATNINIIGDTLNLVSAPGYNGALLSITASGTGLTTSANVTVDGNDCYGNAINGRTSALVNIDPNKRLNINSGTFTVKNGNSTGNGGGIYNNKGIITVNSGGKLILSGNTANYGGGIYNTGTITNSDSNQIILENNNATTNGGGIWSSKTGPSNDYYKINVTAIGNNANYWGGGIYNSGGFVEINGYISGNYAENNGGGIYSDSGNKNRPVKINATVFENRANNGGGIHTGNPSEVSGIISGNTANITGGGIYNTGTMNVTGGSLTVSGNTATMNGGGIYSSYGNITIFDNAKLDVLDNYAESYGGGIYLSGYQHYSGAYRGIMTVNPDGLLNVSGNTANAKNGGGIYNSGGKIYDNGILKVQSNTAGENGGGIYNSDGNGVGEVFLNYDEEGDNSLINSIYNNTAKYGGGIWSSSKYKVFYGGIPVSSLPDGNIKGWFDNDLLRSSYPNSATDESKNYK